MAACLLLLLTLAAAPPQDTAAAADVETLATATLELMADALDDDDPERALEALQDFDSVYGKVSDKTLKKILKSIGSMFSKLVPKGPDTRGRVVEQGARPRDDEEQPDVDNQTQVLACYRMAAALLFDKEEGPSVLKAALKELHVKGWPDARALLYEGLGHRAEPALMGEFTAVLGDAAPEVASSAAAALGHYADGGVALRRKAVGPLVTAYEQAQAAADKEAKTLKDDEESPRPAAEYLAGVETAFHEALCALTRKSHAGAAAWREWFAQHGNEDTW